MRRHTSQRTNTSTSNWTTSIPIPRPRSHSVGELVRSRSDGWTPDTIHPSLKRQTDSKTDYPDPPFGLGDYHQIERTSLAVHNEEIRLKEYLKSALSTPSEQTDYLKEKYLLLAGKAMDEGKLQQTAEKFSSVNMVIAFFLAARVHERRKEYQDAIVSTVLIDRGHTGRALAMKQLMEEKLVSKLPQSPRGTDMFQNNNNLQKYRIPEKVVRNSTNPRFHRSIPDKPDNKLFLIPISARSENDGILIDISLDKTTLDLKKIISSSTCQAIENIKPQIGPGILFLGDNRTLYEQGIQSGTVVFY